jgi:RecA/RadA recombinase
VNDESITQLQTLFDRQYGLGIFTDASSILDSEQQILSTTPMLDLALGGGIPEGSWVTLSGDPKQGKSTMSLTLAAVAQAQGRMVVYADVEARLKKKNLTGIAGLDLSPAKFRLIRSTPEKLLNGPEFLNQILAVLETVPRAFIIIDSVSALAEKKEMEEGVEALSRGGINKQISLFCRVAGQAVMVNKSVVVGITHRIANTSGFGAPRVEKAASAWKFQRDVYLRIKKVDDWSVGDSRTLTGTRQIGQKVTWVVEESALGPPGAEVKTFLRYGEGYDKDTEFFDIACGFGLVSRAEKGGMVTFSFLGGKNPPKFRGDERACAALKADPETFGHLKKLVMDKLTGVDE